MFAKNLVRLVSIEVSVGLINIYKMPIFIENADSLTGSFNGLKVTITLVLSPHTFDSVSNSIC